MKMKKRFLGILLSLMMVLGLMPGIVPEAGATGETWTDWKSGQLYPSTPGNYTIEESVEISSTWHVPGETKLWLTSNGKITLTGNAYIELDNGSGDHLIIVGESTGSIIDNASANNTVISVSEGTTFEMQGGTIKNNNTMYSVDNSGTFNMSGGTINNAGGRSAVENSGKGTFTMTGGTINADGTDTTAVNNNGGYPDDPIKFTMSGNAVINAEAAGVINYATEFTMSGGKITGQSTELGKGVASYFI